MTETLESPPMPKAPKKESNGVASSPDKTPNPVEINPKGLPNCSGRMVRDYLKASNTSPTRIAKIDEIIAKTPGITGKLLVEQMIADRFQTGTVEKAGRFVFGTAFRLDSRGPSAMTEELESLRERIANLEAHTRGQELKNSTLLNENSVLRGKNEALQAELENLKSLRPAA